MRKCKRVEALGRLRASDLEFPRGKHLRPETGAVCEWGISSTVRSAGLKVRHTLPSSHRTLGRELDTH